MAKKKDQAFFICPRWNEVAPAFRAEVANGPVADRGHEKIVAAIAAGRPVARSTLRKALLAVRQASGATFDINDYIVDRRGPR